MYQNFNDNQRYLKSREIPDGIDLAKKATLHKGYQGYLDMIKKSEESDDEVEGRSMIQEHDYGNKKKARRQIME